MADDDIATKAPESDAADKSIIAGDTPAQEAPAMGVGPDCYHSRSTHLMLIIKAGTLCER